MSDDTIRKALEVAAQELEGSAAAMQWLAEPEELAAAAIAAFLRALPKDHALRWWDAELHRHGGCDVRALHALAAAVEQEALDD